MSGLRILIVEDELLIAEEMRMHLEQIGYQVVGLAIKYTEAIRLIDQYEPDMILLDIQLAGSRTGIDLAKDLAQRGRLIPFVYITSFADRKTLKAAKSTEPYGYLVKPFNQDDLFAAIEVAMTNFEARHPDPDQRSATHGHLVIRSNFLFVKIPFDDILYLEADRTYTLVHTVREVHKFRQYLADIEGKLPASNFARVHRSIVVNLAHVHAAKGGNLVINGKKVPVARRRWKEVLTLLKEFEKD